MFLNITRFTVGLERPAPRPIARLPITRFTVGGQFLHVGVLCLMIERGSSWALGRPLLLTRFTVGLTFVGAQFSLSDIYEQGRPIYRGQDVTLTITRFTVGHS